MIDHLLRAEEASGKTPQMLLDAPSCPDGCDELWSIFNELHSCRGSSGFGPQRITYTDLDAFQRVSGVTLKPWEIEAVQRADRAFLADWAERNKPSD